MKSKLKKKNIQLGSWSQSKAPFNLFLTFWNCPWIFKLLIGVNISYENKKKYSIKPLIELIWPLKLCQFDNSGPWSFNSFNYSQFSLIASLVCLKNMSCLINPKKF